MLLDACPVSAYCPDLPADAQSTPAFRVSVSGRSGLPCPEARHLLERRRRPLNAAANPDRRVRRTRRSLKEALSELLAERDYDAITVQEIADRADVGRSTFYAHFESKEDLLFAGVDRHLMAFVEGVPPGVDAEADGRRFRFSLPLLRHVRLQRRFFEATILGGSNARLREVSAGIMTDVVLTELHRLASAAVDPASGSGSTRREHRMATARAVVGAFMGLLDWWLRSAEHLPAEAVDEVFQRVASGLVSGEDVSGLADPET